MLLLEMLKLERLINKNHNLKKKIVVFIYRNAAKSGDFAEPGVARISGGIRKKSTNLELQIFPFSE